jgi:ribokinase
MIVIVGSPAWDPMGDGRPVGLACEVALAAAEAGAPVELVGRTGDDAAGDALLLDLARSGVGHVALLRDAARPTRDGRARAASEDAVPVLEAADIELGLAYLTAFDVLVVTDDVPSTAIPVCVDAATFAEARLIVVLPPAAPVPDGLPEDATVMSAAGRDEAGFARMVGRYAVGLSEGAPAEAALGRAAREVGWAPTGRA